MRLKIMIVDDLQVMQSWIVDALRDAGYDAFSAGSGWEALEVLRSGEDVAVVITDQIMPGMCGTDLFQQCRDEFGEDRPYFILFTAYSEINTIILAKKLGFEDIVVKSHDLRRLLTTLEGVTYLLQMSKQGL